MPWGAIVPLKGQTNIDPSVIGHIVTLSGPCRYTAVNPPPLVSLHPHAFICKQNRWKAEYKKVEKEREKDVRVWNGERNSLSPPTHTPLRAPRNTMRGPRRTSPGQTSDNALNTPWLWMVESLAAMLVLSTEGAPLPVKARQRNRARLR